jgi:hypothetical protein
MNELLFGSNNPIGAFQYFNRNPSLIPTKDQTRSLLNNIKILENNNKIMSIEKVYRRLLKQNVLTNCVWTRFCDIPLMGANPVD